MNIRLLKTVLIVGGALTGAALAAGCHSSSRAPRHGQGFPECDYDYEKSDFATAPKKTGKEATSIPKTPPNPPKIIDQAKCEELTDPVLKNNCLRAINDYETNYRKFSFFVKLCRPEIFAAPDELNLDANYPGISNLRTLYEIQKRVHEEVKEALLPPIPRERICGLEKEKFKLSSKTPKQFEVDLILDKVPYYPSSCIKLRNIPIHIRVTFSGTPDTHKADIIAWRGLGMDQRWDDGLIKKLSTKYRLVEIWLPGHPPKYFKHEEKKEEKTHVDHGNKKNGHDTQDHGHDSHGHEDLGYNPKFGPYNPIKSLDPQRMASVILALTKPRLSGTKILNPKGDPNDYINQPIGYFHGGKYLIAVQGARVLKMKGETYDGYGLSIAQHVAKEGSLRVSGIVLFENDNERMSNVLSILKQVVEMRKHSDHGQIKYGKSIVYKFWQKNLCEIAPKNFIKSYGYEEDLLYRPELLELTNIVEDRPHYEVKDKSPYLLIKPSDKLGKIDKFLKM